MSAPTRLTAQSGTFETYPKWLVLYDAMHLRFTGMLALIHPQKKKSLLFEAGTLVGTRTSLASESFMQLLLSSEILTPAQLREQAPDLETLDLTAQIGLLVSKGLINPSNIQSYIDTLYQNRIHEILTWNEGRFAFVNQLPSDGVKLPHSHTILDILYEGMLARMRPSKDSLDQVEIERGERSHFLDLLMTIPPKLKLGLQRGLNQNNKGVFKADTASLGLKDVQKHLMTLSELGVIKMTVKPVVAPNSAQPKFKVSDLQAQILAMGKQDHYTVLRIKRQAREDEIKSAFIQLAKVYHPDQLPDGVDPEIRKCVGSIFAMISQAHAQLIDAKKRQEYDAELAVKESGIDAKQADRILEGERLYLKAEALVKKADFDQAIQDLSEAIRLNDTEPDYHMLIGWSMFKSGHAKKNTVLARKGKESLLRALAMRPTLVQAHYYMGLVHKSENDMNAAKTMFEKVLELAPHHAEASSELRLIVMREQKSGGGLKSLFQKKNT